MSKLELLSAGFSAILGREVVLQEDVLKESFATWLLLKLLGFRWPSPKSFPIFVRGLFGLRDFSGDVRSGYGNTVNTLILQVTERHSVFQMKLQIQEKVGIALRQFDLIFGNKCLDDDRLTVQDYGLQSGSIVCLVLRLKLGGLLTSVSTDELAAEFDYDFIHAKDDGKRYYMRGGFEYKRQCGWKRFAVKAVGRYENDKLYAEGFYTSPSLEMVEREYVQEFNYDGKRYKIALQSRVNPDPNGHLTIISAWIPGVEAVYWLSPNESDLRSNEVVFREIRQTESRTDRIVNPMFSPISTRQPDSWLGYHANAQSAEPSPNYQRDSTCSLM